MLRTGILILMIIFFSCGFKTSKDALVRTDQKILQGMQGKTIAYVLREAPYFLALKHKEYKDNTLGAGVYAPSIGRQMFMKRLHKKSKKRTKSFSAELGEPFQELRNRLVDGFVGRYQMKKWVGRIELATHEYFRHGIVQARGIHYFIDVQPLMWGVVRMKADKSKYYYNYRADIRLIQNKSSGKVLGHMRCRYQSTENFNPQYRTVNGRKTLIVEQKTMIDRIPRFSEWFADNGRLSVEHTKLAVEYCLNKFNNEVLDGVLK